MKKQLIAAVAIGLLAGSASAQSAFEGFYGQIATGYENNTVASSSPVVSGTNGTAPSSSSGNAPAIIGLGYTFMIDPTYSLALGADYSILSQNTNNIQATNSNGQYYYQVSQRTNFFIAPGYNLAKDKTVYIKAGYSMENIQAKPAGGGTGTNSSNIGGYLVGLGYKQMIADGFYGFAEGNYMSYSKPVLTASGFSANTGTPSAYTLLVGLGYKF
ncbi:porin family protein [Polynucleobacter paneuropaeus]|nr:porin family protein [Polynucleobacter paneuropaeus]